MGALRGVDARQAAWKPGPRRKTIWHLALHIAYWTYAVRRKLEGESGGGQNVRFPRTPANWPEIPTEDSPRAWSADVALLKAERIRLLAAIESIPVARLRAHPPASKLWTYGELIVGIAQHEAYHTGQIQLLRRLWQERSGNGSARKTGQVSR